MIINSVVTPDEIPSDAWEIHRATHQNDVDHHELTFDDNVHYLL